MGQTNTRSSTARCNIFAGSGKLTVKNKAVGRLSVLEFAEVNISSVFMNISNARNVATVLSANAYGH